MNAADGSGVTRLTDDPDWDGEPSWSPDGTKIAFSRTNPSDLNSDIYVMNAADGTNVTRLTDSSSASSAE
jgi:Tol biopolymer transport system component